MHGDNLDGDVADFGQEAVEDGAAEKDVKAGADGLTEDDVGDAFLLGESDQGVRDIFVVQGDDLCAEVLGHAAVFFDALKGFGIVVALVFVGTIDVDGVPVCSKAASNARADG